MPLNERLPRKASSGGGATGCWGGGLKPCRSPCDSVPLPGMPLNEPGSAGGGGCGLKSCNPPCDSIPLPGMPLSERFPKREPSGVGATDCPGCGLSPSNPACDNSLSPGIPLGERRPRMIACTMRSRGSKSSGYDIDIAFFPHDLIHVDAGRLVGRRNRDQLDMRRGLLRHRHLHDRGVRVAGRTDRNPQRAARDRQHR